MTNEEKFAFELAENCFHNNHRFEEYNNFFKNLKDEDVKKAADLVNVKESEIEKYRIFAKENRLNIYLQNVLVLC